MAAMAVRRVRRMRRRQTAKMMMSECRKAAPGRHMPLQNPCQRSTCHCYTWQYHARQRRPCRCQPLCLPQCPNCHCGCCCCCSDGDGSEGGEEDEDQQDDDEENEEEEEEEEDEE
jgi:hypothetical protein